jgi:hypothetical protein
MTISSLPRRFPYYAVILCIYFANSILQIHPLYGWALRKLTIVEIFCEESSVLSEQF